METIITTLKPILENPKETFGLRELSRLTNINHTTIRQRLIKYEKEGLIIKKDLKQGFEYTSNKNEKFKLFKKYYNLEVLRESKIIDYLIQEYDYPTIVLFGSFALAEDLPSSDIDICIISNIKKELNFKEFEKQLKKKIQIHHFTNIQWKKLIHEKHELVNSIANGITLSGHLEIL